MVTGKSVGLVATVLAMLAAHTSVAGPPNTERGEAAVSDQGAAEVVETAAHIGLLSDFADEAISSAGTSSLDVWLESKNGSSTVVVLPGRLVEYRILGLLSDDANEGLALIGLSVSFEGGDLEQADTSTGDPESGCENPMIHFTKPWGITNPAGYGGTIIGGELIEVGGGQNTVNNTPENAEFPIGTVLTGVAQPSGCGPTVLVTGRLTAPQALGTYRLRIFDVFANVIKEGEDGVPYWATEAALIGNVGNLEVIVSDRKPTRQVAPDAYRRARTIDE